MAEIVMQCANWKLYFFWPISFFTFYFRLHVYMNAQTFLHYKICMDRIRVMLARGFNVCWEQHKAAHHFQWKLDAMYARRVNNKCVSKNRNMEEARWQTVYSYPFWFIASLLIIDYKRNSKHFMYRIVLSAYFIWRTKERANARTASSLIRFEWCATLDSSFMQFCYACEKAFMLPMLYVY